MPKAGVAAYVVFGRGASSRQDSSSSLMNRSMIGRAVRRRLSISAVVQFGGCGENRLHFPIHPALFLVPSDFQIVPGLQVQPELR